MTIIYSEAKQIGLFNKKDKPDIKTLVNISIGNLTFFEKSYVERNFNFNI